MTKTERQAREQALLDTALACFNTDQWENVSVSTIAKHAGVAKGTVYLHFSSKHEIYARLALQFYTSLLAECQCLTGVDSRSRLTQLIHTVFRQHQEKTEYRRVTQYCQRDDFIQNLNTELARSLKDVEQQFQALLTDILASGTKDGSWGSNAQDNMLGMYYTMKGALNQFCVNKFTTQESQIEFISMVANYILASAGPRALEKKPLDTSPSTLDLVLEL